MKVTSDYNGNLICGDCGSFVKILLSVIVCKKCGAQAKYM